ncbi:MAG: hypothetical protein K1X83_13790 [Oligoflexia bacterium]|nr:hypothetical protein [Oligoflexia bacterium]
MTPEDPRSPAVSAALPDIDLSLQRSRPVGPRLERALRAVDTAFTKLSKDDDNFGDQIAALSIARLVMRMQPRSFNILVGTAAKGTPFEEFLNVVHDRCSRAFAAYRSGYPQLAGTHTTMSINCSQPFFASEFRAELRTVVHPIERLIRLTERARKQSAELEQNGRATRESRILQAQLTYALLEFKDLYKILERTVVLAADSNLTPIQPETKRPANVDRIVSAYAKLLQKIFGDDKNPGLAGTLKQSATQALDSLCSSRPADLKLVRAVPPTSNPPTVQAAVLFASPHLLTSEERDICETYLLEQGLSSEVAKLAAGRLSVEELDRLDQRIKRCPAGTLALLDRSIPGFILMPEAERTQLLGNNINLLWSAAALELDLSAYGSLTSLAAAVSAGSPSNNINWKELLAKPYFKQVEDLLEFSKIEGLNCSLAALLLDRVFMEGPRPRLPYPDQIRTRLIAAVPEASRYSRAEVDRTVALLTEHSLVQRQLGGALMINEDPHCLLEFNRKAALNTLLSYKRLNHAGLRIVGSSVELVRV